MAVAALVGQERGWWMVGEPGVLSGLAGRAGVGRPLVLGLESSCDETAAAVVDGSGRVLSSVVASQIDLHQRYGGVVPEIASRQHVLELRPVIEAALGQAGVGVGEIDVVAATAGPGLSSSLLMGHTAGRALAMGLGVAYRPINHLEGHLLSPFMGGGGEIEPCVGLVVSGGHTLLVELRGVGDYRILGSTRDDAAGEAFDKVGKLLGLPYPGGPHVEKVAAGGDAGAFDFPRSFMTRADPRYEFSFSGVKNAARRVMEGLGGELEGRMGDVCASFQEAVVAVLVEKSARACRDLGLGLLAVSGGVSGNGALRRALEARCEREGIRLLVAGGGLTTDNAAMIAYVGLRHELAGIEAGDAGDIDPNLRLGADG
jgi:N6-L-threonylcarbamoyladenine synthase